MATIKNAVPMSGRGDEDGVFSLCFFVERDGVAALRFHDDGAGHVVVVDASARALGSFTPGRWSSYAAARSPLRSRARPAVGSVTFVGDDGVKGATRRTDDDLAVIEVSDDAEKLWVFYPSAVENTDSYVRPSILIEFGGRNSTLPQSMLAITPDIAKHVPAAAPAWGSGHL